MCPSTPQDPAMRFHAHLTVLLTVLAPASSAQIIVTSAQERFVEANASVNLAPPSVDSAAAPAFGPFADSVAAAQASTSPAVSSSASSSQNSTIGADFIEATGDAGATTSSPLSDASGASRCHVTFTVSQSVSYRASGTLESVATGSAFFQIIGVNTDFVLSQFATVGSSFPLGYSGVLPPGTYRFEADALAFGQDGGSFAGGEATFNVRLDLAAVTASDCLATPNSTGDVALIHTADRAWPNQFRLGVTGGVPGAFGLMIYGQPVTPSPHGDGLLCVGQPLVRFPSVVAFDASGAAEALLSSTQSPFNAGPGAITFGSMWTFQLWYRDNAAQQSGFNLSNTLTVNFVP